MKLMINGALTVGTLDGANVEILRQVGNENMFLFGMTVEEVEALVRSGSYDPWNLMQSDADLSAILRLLSGKIDGVRFTEVFHSLTAGDHKNSDAYFILQDFASYKEAQQKVDQAYRDTLRWNRMSLHNIAGAGLFSADRAVLEYADRIWHVPPMANGGSDAHI